MANIAENLFESLQLRITERGNTSLRNYENGDVVFYHEVAVGVWLEIVHMHENYPAWAIQTVTKSKREIISHIEENFSDPWIMQKNNINVNTHNNFSPMSMAEALERVETSLYNDKKKMETLDEIYAAVQNILDAYELNIGTTDKEKMVNEYYNTL